MFLSFDYVIKEMVNAAAVQPLSFIIQHIDTLPKYGKKLSMYVGPHDVYPTIDVNCSMLTRECKNKKLVDNIFSSNFVLLSMCWIIKPL